MYVLVVTATVAAAEAFAAREVRGRFLWGEVFWAVYFIIAWRLAWAVWVRTVGKLGERFSRWGRLVRRSSHMHKASPDGRVRLLSRVAVLVKPMRFFAVLLVFAPLAMGSLIHRLKIGNAEDFGHLDALPIERVTFETSDGLTISGWFLPDDSSDSTVVICHGSGANKGNFIEYLALFHDQGFSSLIFDARAHGDSDGHTSTFGLFETRDVRAAVDWLKRERPRKARHVFGLGSSMGAMTLVRAAADDDRIEAIVLDSCFASAPLLADQHTQRFGMLGRAYAKLVLASMSLHAGASMWDLDALEAIAKIAPRPVFLIHGEDDFVIPPVNLPLLFDAANEPKQKWLGPGLHSNILTADYYTYQTKVVDFFNDAIAAR